MKWSFFMAYKYKYKGTYVNILNAKIKKMAEHRRVDAFEMWCWRRLFRVPFKEIQLVHPKGDQSWVFIGRMDMKIQGLTPEIIKGALENTRKARLYIMDEITPRTDLL